VLDAQTGSALPGVEVLQLPAGLSTLTDKKGQFKLGDIPSGEHTLVIFLPGYATRQEVVSLAAEQTLDLTFTLHPLEADLSTVIVQG
jgi:hypothetical protein